MSVTIRKLSQNLEINAIFIKKKIVNNYKIFLFIFYKYKSVFFLYKIFKYKASQKMKFKKFQYLEKKILKFCTEEHFKDAKTSLT